MTPLFRIVADGADITGLINDRLIQLSTTDKPGMDSDTFELRIDDRDGQVTLPRRGVGIEVYLGYAETGLARQGRYVVDEVSVSGPPDTIVIKGKASDMRGSGKTIRSGSWEDVPLSKIVGDIAARNGWQAVCPVSTKVARADQLNESDFNFITRLATGACGPRRCAQPHVHAVQRVVIAPRAKSAQHIAAGDTASCM
jgi:phage protein D